MQVARNRSPTPSEKALDIFSLNTPSPNSNKKKSTHVNDEQDNLIFKRDKMFYYIQGLDKLYYISYLRYNSLIMNEISISQYHYTKELCKFLLLLFHFIHIIQLLKYLLEYNIY